MTARRFFVVVSNPCCAKDRLTGLDLGTFRFGLFYFYENVSVALWGPNSCIMNLINLQRFVGTQIY
jgi:hypothetical protein